MVETVDVLRWTQTLLFLAVGAWALVRWRRVGADADRWLAATFGVLGVGTAVSMAAGLFPDGDAVQWLRRTNLFVVSFFPYLLVRFLGALRPVPQRSTRVLLAACAVLGASALLLPSVPAPTEPRDLVYRAWVAVLALTWLVVLPAVGVRLWRAGRELPTIPRRRLRTLALGVAALSLALVLAGAVEDPTSPLGAAVTIASFTSSGLFLLGFAPPRWLRTLWRQPEEARFHDVALELVATGDAQEVARLMAPYAREVLGARAAEIHADGTCLARDGEVDGAGDPVEVPLTNGALLVWPDVYLQVVGDDDWTALRRVALLIDLALARGELQQMALLLGEDGDHGDLVHEVLRRARHQLHARTCALLLDVDGALEVASCVGDDALVAGIQGWIDMFEERPDDTGGPMLVPVSADRGPRGVLAVWFDATAQRHGREHLARTLGTFLGLALAMRHRRSLERDLVRELQQSSDARRDFMASVSHELRTPLTSIKGFTHALLDHGERLDHATQQDMLRRIARRADALSVLVEQLLEVASDDDRDLGAPHLETIRLGTVLADVAASVAAAADRQVDVDLGDETVWADEARLRAVVEELLRNAVKFSAAPSPVVLSAAAQGNEVRILVRDHGVGMSPRDTRHAFDPFYRAASAVQQAKPGTGVGLALVRGQATSMGGRVEVTSAPGVGSTFTVVLPSAAATATDARGSVVVPFRGMDLQG